MIPLAMAEEPNTDSPVVAPLSLSGGAVSYEKPRARAMCHECHLGLRAGRAFSDESAARCGIGSPFRVRIEPRGCRPTRRPEANWCLRRSFLDRIDHSTVRSNQHATDWIPGLFAV